MSLDLYLTATRETTVGAFNVTHNLTRMAEAAGIYKALWCPEEVDPPITTAAELLPVLKAGLKQLRADPDRFRALNPKNGWGNYDGFVTFVCGVIEACESNPDAKVSVSR